MEDVKTMGISEARAQLGNLVEEAFFNEKPTVITHAQRSEPRAALISHKAFLELEAYRAKYGPLTD